MRRERKRTPTPPARKDAIYAMRALTQESSARRETNYMLVRCCALTAVLVVPMLVVGIHRPDETTGEVHTDEALLPEPAAYTRSVHYTRADHTLRYGDEGRLRAKVPLLPGATYAAFVKSMPIVCVDVLLTRNSDGAALLVLRHSEPVRGLHWFPGGRLLFGETFTEAALRKVRALQGSLCAAHYPLSLCIPSSRCARRSASAPPAVACWGRTHHVLKTAVLGRLEGHVGCEWPQRAPESPNVAELFTSPQRAEARVLPHSRASAAQLHCTTRWNTPFEKSAWDAPTQTVRPYPTSLTRPLRPYLRPDQLELQHP